MKVHIRVEYHSLRQVGVLNVHDSSLNMLKELTDHQNIQAHEMNEQLNSTMKANFLQGFNMIQQEDVSKDPRPSPLLLRNQTTCSRHLRN